MISGRTCAINPIFNLKIPPYNKVTYSFKRCKINDKAYINYSANKEDRCFGFRKLIYLQYYELYNPNS